MKDERFPDLHERADVPHLLNAQLRFIDHIDFLRSHAEFSQTMQGSAVRQPRVELNMDLIDDPVGEGKSIHKLNPWLTYGTPLHRLREFGVTAKEIDMIDEEKLSIEQMRNVCAFM